MTREQAYQQADTENIFAKDETNTDIIFRAMEIFAGAFAEWVDKEYFQWYSFKVNSGWYSSKLDYGSTAYTTSQLIAEFEKIENK